AARPPFTSAPEQTKSVPCRVKKILPTAPCTTPPCVQRSPCPAVSPVCHGPRGTTGGGAFFTSVRKRLAALPAGPRLGPRVGPCLGPCPRLCLGPTCCSAHVACNCGSLFAPRSAAAIRAGVQYRMAAACSPALVAPWTTA